MIKKITALLMLALFTIQSSYAFEDYIAVTDAKLTDINVEDNTVVDVFPLVTIDNSKNTLIIHPLREGKTRFCVLKDNKNLALFNVTVNEHMTIVNAPAGFELLSVDPPVNNNDFTLDTPPEME